MGLWNIDKCGERLIINLLGIKIKLKHPIKNKKDTFEYFENLRREYQKISGGMQEFSDCTKKLLQNLETGITEKMLFWLLRDQVYKSLCRLKMRFMSE